ncbi:hypothetical protein ACIQXQ_20690 [Peribacillus sp. NPDC097198]|uniref:hypothetical protein n=1 Tax=Peribacillus sp. NPDC097198 TaxID=3364397 RepID=UPI0037FC5A88
MGKLSEAFDLTERQWGFSFFEEQKLKIEEIKKSSWGNRDHLNQLGTLIEDMKWHDKPIRFFSPLKQMELYFGWMKDGVGDYRTRRIIGAKLDDYFVPINEEEYEKIKNEGKKEIRFKTKHALEFDLSSVPVDHPYHFGCMLSMYPEESYIDWVVNGDESKKEFVSQYGTIKEIKIPMVKQRKMTHKFYTPSKAKRFIVRDFKGKKDSYYNTSMTYQIPSKRDFRRLGERVTEFCLLFSEIDFYKEKAYKHMKQKDVLQLIYKELDEHGFPRPTEVVYPRGLHLVWKINPIPSYRSWEWVMMQKKIHSILKPFGSDAQTVTDKVRLLRLVGTIHSKTGKKIWGQSYTDDRYSFDELIGKFCSEEVEKEKKKREKNRKRYEKSLEKKFEVIEGGKRVLKQASISKEKPLHDSNYVGNIIHEKYRRDLVHLINLREGNMDGYREFCCFLMRYWTLCITDGQTVKAIREMEKLYYSMDIKGDYTLQEIISYTKSAERGFKLWKKNWRNGYSYRNDTLVEKLDITKEEQKSMWIMMDEEETKRRERERDYTKKKEKRKASGSVGNDELREEIIRVTEENPGMKSYKVAELVKKKMGKCSKNTVEKVWARETK